MQEKWTTLWTDRHDLKYLRIPWPINLGTFPTHWCLKFEDSIVPHHPFVLHWMWPALSEKCAHTYWNYPTADFTFQHQLQQQRRKSIEMVSSIVTRNVNSSRGTTTLFDSLRWESLQDASEWDLKRKLLTRGFDSLSPSWSRTVRTIGEYLLHLRL